MMYLPTMRLTSDALVARWTASAQMQAASSCSPAEVVPLCGGAQLVQTFKGMARDTQEVMKETHGARLHRIMKVDKLLGGQACRLFQMLDLLAFY